MSITLHRWGAGRPLVLLHGWTMTGAAWAPVAPLLHGLVLAPDLPAHGGTRGYAPTVAGGVALLDDLLAGHDLREVTLIGWSLGALIGWAYLGRGGDRVTRMISVDMSPRPLPAPGWACAMRGQSADKAARAPARFVADWPGAAQAIARAMFAEPDSGASSKVSRAQEQVAANDPATMGAFWQSLTEADLREVVARLPKPLLAIHGARSRVYPPETAHWIARTAPNGKALVLPGCGHSPHLEDPQAFAAAVNGFVDA